MKFFKILTAFAVAIVGIQPVRLSAEQDLLIDSGIDYTESTETINNPCAGYTSTIWYTCKPDNTPVYNPTGNLTLMFINIGAFSCGSNGSYDDDGNYTEGVDYDLDDAFFSGLRATFENARQNGCTIALRFRYDENGKSNPEPASFDKVLGHINQIKESGILEEYSDILAFVESGFVGAWGEQHSGKYVSLEYKAEILDAVLDMVPDEIPVTVRTPNIVAQWLGISLNTLGSFTAEKGSQAARVGIYNDGYMGSDSDLGTFSDRKTQTDWMYNQMRYTYYGGEFSGNIEFAKKYDTYLPENAIPEMYKTHLTYINSNIYSLYKDYTFGSEYDMDNVDNSAYYGQTVFKFIRDHLGYRFVLRDSDITEKTCQGGNLTINASVENTGFANPVKAQKAEIILEKDGNYISAEADTDTREWYSCSVNDISLSFKLPAGMETGKWNVYFKLSVGNYEAGNHYMRSVQFANNDIWNGSLGANYMGSFEVTPSSDRKTITDNEFYQLNPERETEHSDGSMLTMNNIIITDGKKSSSMEWNDSLMLAQSENGSKIYITNDDKLLYIMAEVPNNAASPVYNFKLRNESDGEVYWLYYMSNGYVYFSHGSYNGCVFKHSGDMAEIKIPFEVMDIDSGTVFSSIRVFVQDTADDWKNVCEIKAEEYTVSDTFNVYSVMQSVKLNQNDTFSFDVKCAVSDADYQWYLDNKLIDGAVEKSYTIKNAATDDKGIYSVLITAPSGVQRLVEICEVTDVFSSGDINGNGVTDVFDVSVLVNMLLNDSQSQYADVNGDSQVNVLDVVELKKIILNN